MSPTTAMTVPISEFAAQNVGEDGAHENISEYQRDLIQGDKERVKREAFDSLKADLTCAFTAPDHCYRPLVAADVIGRNRC